MKKVIDFLRNSKVFYLATCDSDKPRVRPFGALCEFENKLYLVTGRGKKVFDQMLKNPNIEISAMYEQQWIRIEGTAIHDDRNEPKIKMLEDNPMLKEIYAHNEHQIALFYLKDSTAFIYSFSGEPETIRF